MYTFAENISTKTSYLATTYSNDTSRHFWMDFKTYVAYM